MNFERLKRTPFVLSPSVAKLLKLARAEPEKAKRLANSLDLLVAVLTQKALPITQQLEKLGITAELARAKFDQAQSKPNLIAGKSLLTRLMTGQFFSGPSHYSEDFKQALSFSWQRCSMKRKPILEVVDLTWGILEADDIVLQPLLETIGLDAKEIQHSLEA